MNKLEDYISNESKLEQESRFKITGMPPIDNKQIEVSRQKFRVYVYYIIIFLFFVFLIKAIVSDLTLFGISGVNFFSNCRFPI